MTGRGDGSRAEDPLPPGEGATGPPEQDDELLDAAMRAAEAAAEVHREEAGRLDPAEWARKGASDFVTEVDREAERRIVGLLRGRFPHHGVMAEEGTPGTGPGEPGHEPPIRWIIDPLDGTTNWLHGYPEYAVSIAALDAHGLRVGVVLNSATGERFEAVRGRGSRRNGEPIRVSRVPALPVALVGTGFPFRRPELIAPYLAMLERVLRSTSGVRRAGSAALDLCDVACGRLDAFWELWLMPWDVAAGALILQEAGGHFAPLEAGTAAAGAAPLREAVEGARSTVEAFRGRSPGGGEPRPGAYLASNRRLADAFRRSLVGGADPGAGPGDPPRDA